jgi:hypothetical protein
MKSVPLSSSIGFVEASVFGTYADYLGSATGQGASIRENLHE